MSFSFTLTQVPRLVLTHLLFLPFLQNPITFLPSPSPGYRIPFTSTLFFIVLNFPFAGKCLVRFPVFFSFYFPRPLYQILFLPFLPYPILSISSLPLSFPFYPVSLSILPYRALPTFIKPSLSLKLSLFPIFIKAYLSPTFIKLPLYI